jgi:hypothetical protein
MGAATAPATAGAAGTAAATPPATAQATAAAANRDTAAALIAAVDLERSGIDAGAAMARVGWMRVRVRPP